MTIYWSFLACLADGGLTGKKKSAALLVGVADLARVLSFRVVADSNRL
jgi:hypothetical protein